MNTFQLAFDDHLFAGLVLLIMIFHSFHLLLELIDLFFEWYQFLSKLFKLIILILIFLLLNIIFTSIATILASGFFSFDGPRRGDIKLSLKFLNSILSTFNMQF